MFGLATRQSAPVRALKGEELLPVTPGFFAAGVAEGIASPGHSLLLCQVINGFAPLAQKLYKGPEDGKWRIFVFTNVF